MDFKKILKNNTIIRRIGKKINIYKAFFYDARDFSKNYVEEANGKNDYRYSIMLLTHSLEKGMCMPDPRPFGKEKVYELINYLKKMESGESYIFEYKIGLSILYSWCDFFEKHEWTSLNEYKRVKEFVEKRDNIGILTGSKEYYGSSIDRSEAFFEVISTRHSVRSFKTEKINNLDIDFAIKCFLETPTACNRQMCRVLYIEKKEIKELLDKVIIGLPGFDKNTIQYFIVTYDLAAFAYSGERYQGLLNVGLCTTNFVNGLHSKGIGSCCLQWSNKYSEDKKVRETLGLRDSERIGVVIASGYYNSKTTIPCSARKTKKDVFMVV